MCFSLYLNTFLTCGANRLTTPKLNCLLYECQYKNLLLEHWKWGTFRIGSRSSNHASFLSNIYKIKNFLTGPLLEAGKFKKNTESSIARIPSLIESMPIHNTFTGCLNINESHSRNQA